MTCSPLRDNASPVMPIGDNLVTLTASRETPGFTRHMLEPVSTIRFFLWPSISTVTVGEPVSNLTETEKELTASIRALLFELLSRLAPSSSFPTAYFLQQTWGFLYDSALEVSLSPCTVYPWDLSREIYDWGKNDKC